MGRTTRRGLPLVVAWLAMAAAGCDHETGASGEPVEATDDGEAPDDVGDPPPGAEDDCAGDGACAGEGLCEAYPCGGRAARFNHFGCPRVACQHDDDCPTGEACFVLAYDRICEPSTTTCQESEGACACEASADCEGSMDAHCLPTQFYPPAEYCDVSQFDCGELPQWATVLEQAADAHDEALGAALEDCAASAREAGESCA